MYKYQASGRCPGHNVATSGVSDFNVIRPSIVNNFSYISSINSTRSSFVESGFTFGQSNTQLQSIPIYNLISVSILSSFSRLFIISSISFFVYPFFNPFFTVKLSIMFTVSKIKSCHVIFNRFFVLTIFTYSSSVNVSLIVFNYITDK